MTKYKTGDRIAVPNHAVKDILIAFLRMCETEQAASRLAREASALSAELWAAIRDHVDLPKDRQWVLDTTTDPLTLVAGPKTPDNRTESAYLISDILDRIQELEDRLDCHAEGGD